MTGQVILVCALMPEAAPIIDALQLREDEKYGALRIFGKDTPTPLCISGIGSHASATAVGLARACIAPEARPSFLNVGVCGHQSFEVGKAWLAHQVYAEQRPDHPLYPGFCERPTLPSDTLHTRLGVERSFATPGGYDMEGYGFLQAALSFACAEQCALLKVVSDGPGAHRDNQVFKLQAKKARALIAACMEVIQVQITTLQKRSAQLFEREAEPKALASLLDRARFSQAQRHRLTRLVMQWTARYPDKDIDPELFRESAQSGLDDLQEQLSQYAPLRTPRGNDT